MLQMMRSSMKSRDLERDPRLTVMTPQCDREATRGDFKLYGRAVSITDPDVRRRYGDTIFAAIGWRPLDPFPLFAVDIERAAYIDFTRRPPAAALVRGGRASSAWCIPPTPDTERGTWE